MLQPKLVEMAERLTLGTEWRELVLPLLQTQAQALEKLALSLPTDRPEPWRQLDDATATLALKSEAKGVRWLAGFLDQEVKVARFERLQNQQHNGVGAGADNPT